MRKENLWGEMMLQDNMNRNDRKGKIQVSSSLASLLIRIENSTEISNDFVLVFTRCTFSYQL